MTTTSDQEPILASWKISEVLHRYPQVLDVLVDLSPAFTKLRNPVMRRVQSRLVTVTQAAEIAGIEPAVLTRKLNQAAGVTAASDDHELASESPHPAEAPFSPPAWMDTAPVATELDVRPIMARGEEPFRAIMEAARTVPVGSVLRLHVGFEPLPLYDELAKQGFTHVARQAGDVWEISFYRERDARSTAAAKPAPAPTTLDWDTPTGAEVTIDVSELVPPEPMVKILQTLETLPPDGRLLVHHVRRPIHLYDRLNDMGYAHETREPEPGHVEVLIQKREATAPSS